MTTESSKNNTLLPTIVVVTYDFDETVNAYLFDSPEKASDFIKTDFENEKRIDIEENNHQIDDTQTYCNENGAVLATVYTNSFINGSNIGKTTWTIASVIDKR